MAGRIEVTWQEKLKEHGGRTEETWQGELREHGSEKVVEKV